MSQRIGALLVTLTKPVDEERATELARAIEQLRDVLEVSTVTDDCSDEMNRMRIRHELTDAVLKVIWAGGASRLGGPAR
jgi:hypothetical protein